MCASTRALPIPREQLRRPSPSVIIVAALAASAFGSHIRAQSARMKRA